MSTTLDKLLAQMDKRNGVVQVKPKSKRSGRQKNITDYYLCLVYDKTEQRYYIVGGLETTEKLVVRLTDRKKPHNLHQYATDPKDYREKTKVERLPYKVVSKNQSTASGMAMELPFPHKEVRVMTGTADFRVMVWNNRGRRSKVR